MMDLADCTGECRQRRDGTIRHEEGCLVGRLEAMEHERDEAREEVRAGAVLHTQVMGRLNDADHRACEAERERDDLRDAIRASLPTYTEFADGTGTEASVLETVEEAGAEIKRSRRERDGWRAKAEAEAVRAERLAKALYDMSGNRTCSCYSHGGPCPRCLVSYEDTRGALALPATDALREHDAALVRRIVEAARNAPIVAEGAYPVITAVERAADELPREWREHGETK